VVPGDFSCSPHHLGLRCPRQDRANRDQAEAKWSVSNQARDIAVSSVLTKAVMLVREVTIIFTAFAKRDHNAQAMLTPHIIEPRYAVETWP